MNVDIENIDYATPGIPLDVYFRFTLKDVGKVSEFRYMIIEVMLVTETVYLAHTIIYNPWSQVGDTLNLKVSFNVTTDDIKNAEWDMYETGFYYQLNQSVHFLSGGYQLLYTGWRGPYHVGFSTYQFIIYWPWPPIILMTCVYWLGFFGLDKFNRRYKVIKYLDEVREKAKLQKAVAEAVEHTDGNADSNESEIDEFDI
ncbi:MAG: hypothetical protein ACTSX2_06715 [Candidatus Thorarchaeota archaeon]